MRHDWSCLDGMKATANTLEIEITRIQPDHFGTWITGEYGDLRFHAKIFDEGSDYGINDGRVSKFFVYEGERVVLEYDRGWSIKPVGLLMAMCEEIRCFLEEAPTGE